MSSRTPTKRAVPSSVPRRTRFPASQRTARCLSQQPNNKSWPLSSRSLLEKTGFVFQQKTIPSPSPFHSSLITHQDPVLLPDLNYPDPESCPCVGRFFSFLHLRRNFIPLLPGVLQSEERHTRKGGERDGITGEQDRDLSSSIRRSSGEVTQDQGKTEDVETAEEEEGLLLLSLLPN